LLVERPLALLRALNLCYVKLLISELFRFRVWDGGSKSHFHFGSSCTKCNVAAKRIYL